MIDEHESICRKAALGKKISCRYIFDRHFYY